MALTKLTQVGGSTAKNVVLKTGGDTGAAVVPMGTEAQKPTTSDKALFRFTQGVGFEGYDPDTNTWGAIGGGGIPDFEVLTANKTLETDCGYLCNVTAKSLVVTLPSSPKSGDWVAIGDFNGSCSPEKTITINPSSGKTIHGHSNLVLTDANVVITLSYISEANQWRVVDGVGENSNGGVISKELEEVRAMLGAFVGQELSLPPTIADVNPALLPKEGGLYSRAAYPLLWNWLEQHPELLVSDADWHKHVSASPIKATPYYSLGNGVDTFRVPTVGLGGFSRAVGSESRPDIATGHQDQLQNITGSAIIAGYKLSTPSLMSDGVGALMTLRDSVDNLTGVHFDNNGDFRSSSTFKFDASRVARTGNETQPKAFYNKVYIYSGNNALGIPTPAPDWMAQQQALTDQIAKAYTTENKPSWSDVGGEGFWTKKADNSYIQAECHWIEPKPRPTGQSDDYTGFLPVGDGKSKLGNTNIQFKEAWVKTYYGGSINITGQIDHSNALTATTYSSVRIPSNQPQGSKAYLRKFSGASGDNHWHETVQGYVYRLATGVSDDNEVFKLDDSAGYVHSKRIIVAGYPSMIHAQNWDTLVTAGYYHVSNATGSNFPTGAYNYGVLEVINTGHGVVWQRYSSDNNVGVYIRNQRWGGGWHPWKKILTTTRNGKISAKQIVVDESAKNNETLFDIIQELRSEIAELKARK